MGDSIVRFANLGNGFSNTEGGAVNVTAVGSSPAIRKAANWSPSGTAETVTVLCFSPAGAPVNSGYTATFLNDVPSGVGPLAYLWNGNPTGTGVALAQYSYDWDGDGNTVANASVGNYTATLIGLGGAPVTAQVTAYGNNADACSVTSIAPTSAAAANDGTSTSRASPRRARPQTASSPLPLSTTETFWSIPPTPTWASR